jgi:hypothetical protein
MSAPTKTLSAGIACADCGFWPMPDPFFAIVDQDDVVDRYVCGSCANLFVIDEAQAGRQVTA